MSGQEPGSRFDPSRYVRQLRGKGGAADYLDIKWRLVWLRSEHPDAQIHTEHVTITDELAIFNAVVSIPGGGSASGYGSETARDFGDFIEKAETKSLGRALAALGYGTQFAQDFDEDDSIGAGPGADLPRARPMAARPEHAPAAARPVTAVSPGARPTPGPTPAPTAPRAEPIPAPWPTPSPCRARRPVVPRLQPGRTTSRTTETKRRTRRARRPAPPPPPRCRARPPARRRRSRSRRPLA